MKKIRVILPVALACVCLFAFAACGDGRNGKRFIEIDDMLVYVNDEPTDIVVTFGGDTETVTYEYEDEYALEIANGQIRAFKTGEYIVKAKTPACETEFTVTCKNAMDISDMYAFIGYPASDISPVLNIEGADEITYSYDRDSLVIENGYVTALKEGKTEVTAKIDGRYDTSFFVTCMAVDKKAPSYYMWDGTWNWKGKAESGRIAYDSRGTDGKTTLFIGDSFFDIDFFSAFYQFYGDYDALCLGIGGTTSHQWEMFFDKDGVYSTGKYGQYAGIAPKNIVVQLGNNNIYNDQSDDEQAAIDVQRFFTFLHGQLPQTKIYYFGVTPRNMAMSSWEKTVKNFNARMDTFCAPKSWITFLDTGDKMTYDKLKDNIHPKPAEYKIFVDALEDAGLELEYKA